MAQNSHLNSIFKKTFHKNCFSKSSPKTTYVIKLCRLVKLSGSMSNDTCGRCLWHEEVQAEVTCRRGPQPTRRSPLCSAITPYADSCLNTHTSYACMVGWGMTSLHTQTHKHTQAAATWPESRTGRHRWSCLGINCMASCLQITHTIDETAKMCGRYLKKKKSNDIKALKSGNIQSCIFHFSSILQARWAETMSPVQNPVSSFNRLVRAVQWMKSMKKDSSQRRCVCAAGTCGWRSVNRSHTGTSSLLSGSAGGRAGWSDQRRPGYSADKRRVAHLVRRRKVLASGQ